MGNSYLRLVLCTILLSMSLPGKAAVHIHQVTKTLIDTTAKAQSKSANHITDTRSNKPLYLKNGVKVSFIPFKPSPTQVKISSTVTTAPVSVIKKEDDGDKVLNNVRVYPNPVGISDKLNLSYNVDKDSNVTIKIMDLLGNEVLTLLNQRISAGSQTNSFTLSDLSSKLNSGFYFIRLIAGSETVIKRISIL